MKTTTDIPYFEDAFSAFQPGLPTVEREAINAIIYNPTKDEVVCLDWEKFGWKSFIIGGIEKGESPSMAAVREIREETGYKNLELIAELGKTRSGYYAAHKNENRISNATAFLFKLVREEREEILDSNLPHVLKWLPRPEVAFFLNLASQKYIWEKAQPYLRDNFFFSH